MNIYNLLCLFPWKIVLSKFVKFFFLSLTRVTWVKVMVHRNGSNSVVLKWALWLDYLKVGIEHTSIKLPLFQLTGFFESICIQPQGVFLATGKGYWSLVSLLVILLTRLAFPKTKNSL